MTKIFFFWNNFLCSGPAKRMFEISLKISYTLLRAGWYVSTNGILPSLWSLLCLSRSSKRSKERTSQHQINAPWVTGLKTRRLANEVLKVEKIHKFVYLLIRFNCITVTNKHTIFLLLCLTLRRSKPDLVTVVDVCKKGTISFYEGLFQSQCILLNH